MSNNEKNRIPIKYQRRRDNQNSINKDGAIERNPNFIYQSRKRDNSALLKRVSNKKYEEDKNKNNLNEYYFNKNFDKNTNINNNQKYFNTFERTNEIINNNENYFNKTRYDNAFVNRVNKNRNKNIQSEYNCINKTEDKELNEYVINYNNQTNHYNDTQNKKKLTKNITQILPNNYVKNQIYSRVKINPSYKVNCKVIYLGEEIQHHNIVTYQKRNVNNYTYKDLNDTSKNDNEKKHKILRRINNSNDFKTYNIPKSSRIPFNIQNHNLAFNRYNDFFVRNSINIYNEKNIYLFCQHMVKYCYQYYYNIPKKLLSYLKNIKNQNFTNKDIFIKNKPIDSNYTKKNVNNYVQSTKRQNYFFNNNEKERPTKIKNNERFIDKIRKINMSKSPERTNESEMWKNTNELNKKLEVINARKNRLSCNKNLSKGGNESSFISEHRQTYKMESNKETFENTLKKERESRKIFLENKTQNERDIQKKNKIKELNDNISKLIIKTDELNNRMIKDERRKENEKKKKYDKRKNIFIVKNILSKDKKIHIIIKYLNYISINSIKNKKNKNQNIIQVYEKENNFSINFLSVNKPSDKSIKNKNNERDNFYKLTAIKEENKVDLLDLSDELSQKSFEKQ
jgi:hypothetical protein